MERKMAFTAARVARIEPAPAGSKHIYYWDALIGGFGLRVSEKGTKAWTLLARYQGKPVQLRIGRYANTAPTKQEEVIIPLSEARKIASEKLQQLERGIDPRVKRSAIEAVKTGPAFEKVAEEFIKQYVQKGIGRPGKRAGKPFRTAEQTELRLRNHPMKAWKGRPVETITRQDVNKLLNDIRDNSGPMMSKKIASLLRTMFDWFIDPCGLITKTPVGEKMGREAEVERVRYLSEDEIRILWPVLETLGYPYRDVYRVLLLTGQRRADVAGMRDSEVDLDAGVWIIPAERYKTGDTTRRDHVVPLTDRVVEILRSLPRRAGSDLFFSNGAGAPAMSFGHAQKAIQKALEAINCGDAFQERWTVHDLRRTIATHCQGIGIAPHLIDAVHGHVIQGVGSTYQRSDMIDEKRRVLEAWERKLNEILNPGPDANVVKMADRVTA